MLLGLHNNSFAQEYSPSSKFERDLKISTDLIYVENKKLLQDVYFNTGTSLLIDMEVTCYKYDKADSLRIYSFQKEKLRIPEGTSRQQFDFHSSSEKSFVQPEFAALLHKFNFVPSGNYKIIIRISNTIDTIQCYFLKNIDSTLNASLYQGLARNLMGQNKSTAIKTKSISNTKLLRLYNSNKLERYFMKKGASIQRFDKDGRQKISVHAKGWFLGQFEVSEISLEKSMNSSNLNSMYRGKKPLSLENQQSLLTQFRELNTSVESSEINAQFSLSTNYNKEQEPFVQQDNNYYELEGMLEIPIFDIPVTIDGFWTSQDKNRKAKARYIHFSYDAEKAKEKMMKLITAYKQKYDEASGQGKDYQMIFGNYVHQLELEKEKLSSELNMQSTLQTEGFNSLNRIKEIAKDSFANILNLQLDSLTESAKKSKALDSLNGNKQKLIEKYQKLQEVEKKINHYQALLNQYKNSLFFDSTLVYDKMKDLKSLEGMSNKDLAKKASEILPEGKSKDFIAGLTNFDAGMFSKSLSEYTLSGQMLTGLGMGYDIGFAELGVIYGKTEYIDGYGNVEAYKTYGGNINFKPFNNQQIGLVYFGYSPSAQLLIEDKFFKSTDVSLPSFRNPVHIVSMTYQGDVSEYLKLNGEYAISNQQKQSKEAVQSIDFKDRSIYKVGLSGDIPETAINLEAAYEYAGSNFENNTLPVLMTGTERVMLKGKGDFFRSFLSLGIEYNYLIQSNFKNKGTQSRWGFDLKTHSKRYPSVMLSYKPFSVFKAINDTLSIDQKPLFGEVWIGRINYQMKKMDRVIRLSATYNKNKSTMDTFVYGSSLIQGSIIYSKQAWMLAMNMGYTQLNPGIIKTAYPIYNNSKFINVSGNYPVLERCNIIGGFDLAYTSMGLSRYGGMLGGMYQFKKSPISIRTNFRYYTLKLNELVNWKPIYSGNLTVVWQMKMKMD